ncbi:FAD-binding oxidoreductase [Streptomyces sp. NEAU-YJ-81]|uniref:FAD-binding oxidoreductase n=1 Tax=Streptomyces sp. NEAU-YJ-81 TaxID=2820288 RepID=UPI001ABC7F32|nr:FAD-binding oxidoreductase [Streptomyces sp. NEAU-YJ-81]MBO3675486.1 FAD-binding oxidoreductase [Streptomyces sp. NEAU-YJ-81]
MAPGGSYGTALTDLGESLVGKVIAPGDAPYDEARRLFNAMIDRRPAAIAQCETAQDVARAIRFARDHDLPIAVRGGGHSVAGMSLVDGGLVIDLRRMDGVAVDPGARTATVGGGAIMSGLDRATQPYGLATTGGRVSTTGVGGFVLGGGAGFLDRAFGLACDNLLSVDLVTAQGDQLHVDEKEHPELFWALHGGGGNFGVATAFTLRLHPLTTMTAMLLLWRPEAGPAVVRAYRDFFESAPGQVGGGLLYLTGPPEEFVPEDMVDTLVCAVLLTYTGHEEQARAITAPLLQLGHDAEMITELPYADLQCMLDDPPGYRNYWSAEYLDTFPDQAVDRFCSRAFDMVVPSPSQHVLFPQGGAVSQGPSDFPLPWREAPWIVHPFGLWDDPADDARVRQWAHDTRADVRPWSRGAVYLNFIGKEGRDRVIEGFGAENYHRLAGVKALYDPDNVFRLNHNIEPRIEPRPAGR